MSDFDEIDLDFEVLGITDSDYYDDYNSDTESPEITSSPEISMSLKYNLDQMNTIVSLFFDQKWSFETLQHKYKKLCNVKEIYRIREYVSRGGTNFSKWEQIDRIVYEEFCEWKNNRIIVHDRDLQETALLAAKKIKLDNFKASQHWISKFKTKHGIVSRKITKFVSTKTMNEEADFEKISKNFVVEVRELIPKFNKVYNTDQSGIKLEMSYGRTLSYMGAKIVEAKIQRSNATTHSFTIQPVTTMDGTLCSPLFVCFFEPEGAPKKFKNELCSFNNLYCVSSTSSLLTSALEFAWFKEHFIKNVEENSLILIDSWTGYKKSYDDEGIKNAVTFKIMPPKTTSHVQPLDVFFNRQFKEFIRRISDKIRRSDQNFVLSIRVNLAKILSFTHRQFTAPRFSDFLKYSWFKAGYVDYRPDQFLTPVQYCFDSYNVASDETKCGCGDFPFMKCAFCENFFCFTHSITTVHTCINNC